MNRFDLSTPDGPPAQRRTYQSADSVVQGEQKGVYPTEFLNSLSISRRGVRVLVRGGSRAALNGAPAGVYTSNVVYREVLQ
ncbi:unnamed protein product [Sphagnum jensenii]